jgi:hypothetical protein
MDEIKLYTTAELAGLFGVSVETIRLWRNASKIRPTLLTPSGRPRWSWPPLTAGLSRQAEHDP